MSDLVVVTGGAGFLGSHLCERLVAEGCRVLCVDDLSTGRAANVAGLADRSEFVLARHDVARPYRFPRAIRAVFHLASPASPAAYGARPIQTLLAGSEGTRHALDAAARTGATLVLASTSEVYGDPEVNPQPETYRGSVSPTGPRSVYDEAKRYAEALTTAYHRTLGVDVRIARIFNTFGPRLAPGDGRVIPSFVDRALAGAPLTVHGDGSQTRSFCYVDDTVEGLIRLWRLGGHEPVNLGNPDERPILDIANLVLRATGSASPITFAPLPEDDPKVRRPDIGRARATLGWEPAVGLDEGLDRTIAWFRRIPRAA